MKTSLLSLILISGLIFNSCKRTNPAPADDIVIENDRMKLVISKEGFAKSLVSLPGQEECLLTTDRIPICTITQERPYQNEIKLAYPTKETTFKSNSVRREGDRLIIGFELIPWEAIVRLKITHSCIGFTIEDFRLTAADYGISMDEPAISEMWFLQLPVSDRSHFGDWLNVSWDDSVAIAVIATDPFGRIDSRQEKGYHIMQAGVTADVKLKGAGAALIVSPTDRLLDNIASVEDDFSLPHGVKSRRDDLYNASYYWTYDVNPANLTRHLKYAAMGGFRAFLIYYTAFTEGWDYRKLGNYDLKSKDYPGGWDDLQKMLSEIKKAGLVPGFHFLHSHIGIDSRYMTPVPDYRLNLLKTFTLSAPLGKSDHTVCVEENPENMTMTDNRRILRIGTELVSYKGYTTERPYKFTGCERGIYGTTPNARPAGYIFGLLDVSEFGATSVYINQNTDLQEEIAEKIAKFYKAGFRFCYFDGSEGVNPPFWFNVSNAQWKVFSRLNPEPLFAEGAAKTHFSWHMLTGGNAFDIFRPEMIKESVRKFPAEEAQRMKDNFTRINFGWLGYWLPDSNTVGTQPDMLEYVTSRAAAWDCPVALQANLALLDAHPRTADNLEVLRRWEEVRTRHWLTEEQKEMLRDLNQEHILLLNEKNKPELLPYRQIPDVASGSREVRAFSFRRDDGRYVVYWHISGDRRLEIQAKPEDITLFEEPGKEVSTEPAAGGGTIVPAGHRRYIRSTNLSEEELATAFRKARIID